MKIGMILDAPFPTDYRVEKEAISLVKAGHQVVLFCLNTRNEKVKEEHNGFLIARYPTNVLEYKLSALAYTVPFYHWMMERKIDAFVESYTPDVLHIHDMVVAPAAIRVARKQNLRVVLDLHENRPEIMKEYRHVNRFPGNVLIDLRTWAKEQAELIAQADKVVVVTELAKSDILKTTKSSSDVIVLPNTPSLDFRDFPLQDRILKKMAGTFNLLYVGDTSLRRGTDDTVRALAALKSQIPEIRLWIVGKSSADPALKQLARDFDLADAVMFEGWQDQSLFGSYMTGAHICLSPLKRNPHHDTTYANKLFQYMAMAKAVIVSDSAAQQRVVEEEGCGLVYPAGDVTMLAETVLTLYRDAPLLKTLGEKGRKAVEDRWNWEKTSEALLEMYKRI